MAGQGYRQSYDREEPLAYGNESGRPQERYEEGNEYGGAAYEGEGAEGGEAERGIIGDTYRKFRGKPPKPPGEAGLGSFIFGKLSGAVQDIGAEIGKRADSRKDQHGQPHSGAQGGDGMYVSSTGHRYGSFATQRTGNDVKWFVDGCGYMWAVSRALEQATESIWILDWWLSPELYLRRPPSRHEEYRLDRMLQAAAQRGVKVNVIVYKEVTQALTRKYLSPTLPSYLHSQLPNHVDPITKGLTALGLAAAFISLQHVEKENPLIAPPITVDSAHTKHALEALHPNISVFRHPDHLPDAQTLQSSFFSSLQNISLSAKAASTMPQDALKAIYGMNEDVVLYWAHHEKLCLIDGKTAFMGGLDLCYGRWDTNQHPIADCHPSNLDNIVYPGQDYNNARIMDFQDVSHWQNNKVDRKESSRMGWSDISISLRGPVIEDLRVHFLERWNFIYNEKYDVRQDVRYSRLTLTKDSAGAAGYRPPYTPPPPNQQPSNQPPSNLKPSNLKPSNQPPPNQPPSNQPLPGRYHPYRPPSSSAETGGSQVSLESGQYPPPPPQPAQGYGVYPSPPPPPQGSHPQSTQDYGQYPPPPPRPAGQPQGDAPYFPPAPPPPPVPEGQLQGDAPYFPPPPPRPEDRTQGYAPSFSPPPSSSSRDIGSEFERQGSRDPSRGHEHHMQRYEQEAENLTEKVRRGHYGQEAEKLTDKVRGRFDQGKQHIQAQYLSGNEQHPMLGGLFQDAGVPCQIVRSCSKWSHGVETEHSVANAYISVIENSKHFVYIENQFFITATSEAQHPVKNKIGAAIVDRILRAARAGQKYKVIVIMPAVPGFAGDLKDDSALGTRAIMEFQYNSINRGGHSIMEVVGNAGYNPTDYIRFYNLRNYDRINVGAGMREAEQRSGVDYADASNEHDQAVELPTGNSRGLYSKPADYQAYTQATDQMSQQKGHYTGEWDSVSECYMLGGRDLRSVPWVTGNVPEIDAFVSEELYIHSKVLIADDRVAIVGSANLNDRSQLGYHDSEIAIIIEDPTPVDSYMDGRPHRASKFAASLRRQLFRKHLGILKPQNMERPDQNFEPIGVPNIYDFGSPEDIAVMDPIADTFLALWNSRARNNTQVFSKVFHTVPDDSVQTWAEYDKFYEHFFKKADTEAEGKDGKKRPSKYMWGHVVAEEFSPGDQGVREVKDLLATVKGTLVEMPLLFLIKEDIAKEGISLNAFTEEVYT